MLQPGAVERRLPEVGAVQEGRAQARAVCRRLLAMDALDAFERAGGGDAAAFVLARLPAHCAHVFCCTECRRVANALQDGGGKDLSFNEIGMSASMLRIAAAHGAGHMRCAKRSSAALRTAVGLEDAARALEVEALAPEGGEPPPLPRDLRPTTVAAAVAGAVGGTPAAPAAPAAPDEGGPAGEAASSDVARLRRDAKNCLEQPPRALACGDAPLVRIPVLGRAVRVFGDWVAICAYCGALAKLTPEARFRADPCCMRCDFAMLRGKAAERALLAQVPKPPPPCCRYCGKQESPGASKFKEVAAPADTGGRNAAVPPPLRKCWCVARSNRRPTVGAYPPPVCVRQVLSPALPRLARAGAPGPAHQRHLRAHFVQGAAHPGRADGEALSGRGRGRDGHARRAQDAQNVQDHEAAAGQGGRPRAAPEPATGCVITNTMTNVLNTTPNPAMTPMINSSKAGIVRAVARERADAWVC